MLAGKSLLSSDKTFGSTKSEIAPLHDDANAWAVLGMELAAAGLDAEEEAELDEQSRAMLESGRTALRESVTQRRRQASWLEFGLELAGVGLEPEEEAILDEHARAAMSAGRVLRRIRGTSAIPDIDMWNLNSPRGMGQSVEVEQTPEVKPRRGTVVRRASTAVAPRAVEAWNLNSPRGMGQSVEVEQTPEVKPRGGTVVRRASTAVVAQPAFSVLTTRWMDFALELADADLLTEEEEMLDSQSKAALAAGRVLQARRDPSTPRKAGQQGAWLEFGLALEEAGITSMEEEELDALSRASLVVARMLRARESSFLSPRGPGQAVPNALLDVGLELAHADLTDAEEQQLDPHTQALLLAGRILKARDEANAPTKPGLWLEFGLALAELDLNAEQEAALDQSARASLAAGKILSSRRIGSHSTTRTRGWVDFGQYLADARLTVEHEAALDPAAKTALKMARVLREVGAGGQGDAYAPVRSAPTTHSHLCLFELPKSHNTLLSTQICVSLVRLWPGAAQCVHHCGGGSPT